MPAMPSEGGHGPFLGLGLAVREGNQTPLRNLLSQSGTRTHCLLSPKRKPLPVIDVEGITASEYLGIAEKAQANSAYAPTFRHISEELKRFPATRGRLATEMLTMAWQSLEKGSDSWHLVMLGSCFGNSVPAEKIQAFIELLERIVLRSIDLMAQSPNAPSSHPFGLGLTMAANALCRSDPGRCSSCFRNVKARHRESAPALAVIDYLEQQMATKRGGDV